MAGGQPGLGNRARARGAWLLAVGIPLLLTGADLARDRGIARFHDNQTVQGPLRLEAARQWSEGRIPLWNPYKRAGAPLLADVSGALYPPNWVFAGATEKSRNRALDLVAVLHHGWAGATAYFLFLTLGLRRSAALFGSLVYSLNGFIVFGTGRWIDLQNAMAWAPLVLACLERARLPGALWSWSAIGALAFAMQIFCGYPEYCVYTALLAGGYALMLALRRRAHWGRRIASLLIVGLGGALLAAPQLLTTLEAVAVGERAVVVPYAGFVALSLMPSDLLGLLVPVGAADVWPRVSLQLANGALFSGIAALAFAGAALCRPRAIGWYALAVTGVAVILALGANSPLGAIGYHVPGLNAFRSPMKHLFELTLGLSILTALGVDRFLEGARGTRIALIATALGLAALAALAAWEGGPTELQSGWISAALGLVVAGAALLRDRRIAVVVALGLLVLSLAQNRSVALEKVRAEAPLPAISPQLRATLRSDPTERVLLLRNPVKRTALVEDLPTAARIAAAHGAGPYLWKPLSDALGMDEIGWIRDPRVLQPGDATLDRLAVRYLLSPRGPKGRSLRERVLRERPDANIVTIDGFLLVTRPSPHPFARFVERVACSGAPPGAARPAERHSATIACPEVGSSPDAIAAAPGEVLEIRVAPGNVELLTRTAGSRRSFLVLSQLDYPGWVAEVDGTAVPILRTFDLLQGVWLPGGEHRVRFSYRPVSFRAGVVLAGLGATSLLWLALRERLSNTDAALMRTWS